MSFIKENFYSHIKVLQNKITTTIEKIENGISFQEDVWKRKEGGGGTSRVF